MELYVKSLKEFRKDIRGYSTIFIIGQSCLGSVAAMFILMNGNSIFQMIQLFIVTIACMLFNAAVLSQRKSEVVFKLLLASILISTFIIIFNSI